jgi:hypothetical protein
VRRVGGALLFLLLMALAAEAVLQLGARWVGDRATAWPEHAQVRILAVGDSHTFGAGVAPEESYPAQLQALLDAQEP